MVSVLAGPTTLWAKRWLVRDLSQGISCEWAGPLMECVAAMWGWCFGTSIIYNFHIYWVSNHPNWRNHIFQRGGETINQYFIDMRARGLRHARNYLPMLRPSWPRRSTIQTWRSLAETSRPHISWRNSLFMDVLFPTVGWLREGCVLPL